MKDFHLYLLLISSMEFVLKVTDAFFFRFVGVAGTNIWKMYCCSENLQQPLEMAWNKMLRNSTLKAAFVILIMLIVIYTMFQYFAPSGRGEVYSYLMNELEIPDIPINDHIDLTEEVISILGTQFPQDGMFLLNQILIDADRVFVFYGESCGCLLLSAEIVVVAHGFAGLYIASERLRFVFEMSDDSARLTAVGFRIIGL